MTELRVSSGVVVAEKFIGELSQLTADDFDAIRRQLSASTDTAAGEISWWQATIALHHELTRTRRLQLARTLAVRASQAVLTGPNSGAVDRSEVVQVARAAGEATQALVAQAGGYGLILLEPWRNVLKRTRSARARTAA